MAFKSLLLILFLPVLVQAQSLSFDFYLWHTKESLAPFLLPVPKGEQPRIVAQKYLKNLAANRDMMDLFYGEVPELTTKEFEPIKSTQDFALGIANKKADYTLDSLRVTEFRRLFESSGYRFAMLPMGLDLTFSRGQIRKLLTQISKEIPVLNSMGGEDVDPKFYQQKNLHSINTNETRDRFEIQLIQEYTKHEKGFFIGVCRGAQIGAVALGYRLIQDIPFQLQTRADHGDSWHPLEVFKTRYSFLYSIFNEAEKVAKPETLQVRSIHHQMIQFVPGGPLDLAALGPDGIVEALEFKNGRGILMQFHPELMQNPFGDLLLTQVLKKDVQIRNSPACHKIFAD